MKSFLSRVWGFHRQSTLKPSARIAGFLALCVLNGFAVQLASELVNTQSIRRTLAALTTQSAQVFGAALFLALCTIFFAGLFRSLFAGGCVVSVVCMLATFVNYFKILITSTPLELQDLALFTVAGDIAGLNAQYLRLSRNSALAIIAVLLWLVVLWYFSPVVRISVKCSLASAIGAAISFALVFIVFADSLFYAPVQVPLLRGYSQTYVNSHTGFVLGLWRSAVYSDDIAADYSEAESERILSEIEGYISEIPIGGDGEKANVILILSESFFDVTGLPGVEYESDPLKEYHALQKEGVSGKFYTRTLGYGTCNIELELLTGINTRLMPYGEALNTWPAEKFEHLPTVPGTLQENGYYTAFLHTYNDAIYNRGAFLPGLSFDETFFSEDFARIDPAAASAGDAYWDFMEERISGWFYSDDYMTDLLIELFEQKTEDSPVFLYGVSMENHSTYTPEKYPQYDYSFTAPLGEEATGALNAATQGMANASQALQKLTDYLRESPEPTVVIFFGDHKPGLGLEAGGNVYSQLGMCTPDSSQWGAQEFSQLYSADYLIWANDPALLPGEPGEVRDDSSNYLGLAVLEGANVEKPDYWRMVESLRGESLIYTWNYYVSSRGEASLELPETQAAAQARFDIFSYLLHDAYAQRYITDKLF